MGLKVAVASQSDMDADMCYYVFSKNAYPHKYFTYYRDAARRRHWLESKCKTYTHESIVSIRSKMATNIILLSYVSTIVPRSLSSLNYNDIANIPLTSRTNNIDIAYILDINSINDIVIIMQ